MLFLRQSSASSPLSRLGLIDLSSYLFRFPLRIRFTWLLAAMVTYAEAISPNKIINAGDLTNNCKFGNIGSSSCSTWPDRGIAPSLNGSISARRRLLSSRSNLKHEKWACPHLGDTDLIMIRRGYISNTVCIIARHAIIQGIIYGHT